MPDPRGAEGMPEHFPAVEAALASLNQKDREVALIRLAAAFNNGSEHFDHGPQGYSWLCLACAQAGRGPFVVQAKEMFR